MADQLEPPGGDNESSDLSVALQVDSLCDAFELSWKEGQRPDLKSYLQTTSVPAQTLFVELVLIDIAYRQKSGESPRLEEYASLFPEFSNALEGITVPTRQSKQSAEEVTVKASEFSRLGHFELRERLGEGAFGVVWKAWDLKLRRWVALKQFREVNSDVSRHLLLREAQVVASIDHPNVVRVHEIGSHLHDDYVAFEYLSGGTLSQWIKHRITSEGESQIAPQLAAETAIQMVRGLQAVHAHGVIHRDFKPGNVLLNEQGVLKIVDFGLARHADVLSTIGGDGLLMGTIPYMSPEQCRGNQEVTARSDIYSLGVVLYEMLTGRRPLQGTRVELLEKIQKERPVPPGQLADIPRSLEHICMRALEKDPRDRYSSATEMQADLEAFLNGKEIVLRRPPVFRRLHRTVRSNALLLSSLILSLAGFGAFLASSQTPAVDGRKVIQLASDPPGARVAMIPLDPSTGIPQPQQIVHARGRTPLNERLVPPGDYLVEVYLDDGNFHEVYRHVPDDREQLSSHAAPLGWRRDKNNPKKIRLPSVSIPMKPVTEEMALVSGSEHFRAGSENDPLLTAYERIVPSFYIDVTEVPLSVSRDIFDREKEPDLQWKQPPTLQHAWCTRWLTAVWVAELLGKRLPDEFEYEYAATNAGTQNFSWGNEPAPPQPAEEELPQVGKPAFDRVIFDRPVFGLCSNVAEWTMNWSTSQYPPMTKQESNRFRSYALLELRVVRGGGNQVIEGSATTASHERNPRDRVATNMYLIKPGLGFRCARSLKPRLTPEDFGRPADSSSPAGTVSRLAVSIK